MGKESSLFRNALIIILITIIANPAWAQRWKLRRYEVGGGLGVTQVFGDIGGTIDEANWFGLKDIKFDETKLAFPLYIRYRLDPVYSLKVNFISGFGHGDDAESRNDRGRSYKVLVNEISAQLEYYFLPEEKRYKSAAMFNRRGMVNNYMTLSAYGFAGIGGFYSLSRELIVPEARSYDDARGTSMGLAIPFGLGAKYIISDRVIVDGEIGYRYSLSDYVEGYKQTAASKHNDVYYFATVKVGYRLETTRRGIPTFLDKEYRSIRTKSVSAKRRDIKSKVGEPSSKRRRKAEDRKTKSIKRSLD